MPLGLIHLSDNIKFQIASFITLLIITIVWVVTFIQVGIKNHPIPVVGSDQGTVVGYVISNFAFVSVVSIFELGFDYLNILFLIFFMTFSCTLFVIRGSDARLVR